MIIFGQVKNSTVINVASVCADSNQFAQYVNEATQRLMTRGNWWGTVRKIQVCVYNGCVTWPRYVGTVLANNVCGHMRPVVGNWYEFMPLNAGDIAFGRRSSGSEFFFNSYGFLGHQMRATVTENDGWSPVLNPISCNTGAYLRFYARSQPDIGKTVTVFGIDSNGNKIQTRDSSGNWSDGVTVVLAAPFASTPMMVRTVERIVKDVTQSPVDAYQYDPNNDILLDLAHYDGQETVPSYAHSLMRGGRPFPSNNEGRCIQQVTALVKLAFQPVVNDNDLVLIDNLAALKLMVMAIKKEDAGDADGASQYEVKAIHELNLALRDKIPLDQVPVAVNSFGTAIPRRAGIGRIL